MANEATMQVLFHAKLDLRRVGADSGDSLQINPSPHHILRSRGTQQDIEATFDGFNVLLQRLHPWLVLPPRVRAKDWYFSCFDNVRESLHGCPQLTQS